MRNISMVYRLSLILVALHLGRVTVLDPVHFEAVGDSCRAAGGEQAGVESPTLVPAAHETNICPLCAGVLVTAVSPRPILTNAGSVSGILPAPRNFRPDQGPARLAASRAPPAFAI